eukprot:TRINITY_DN4992_c0_g1_i1.p1 TRINITY_DN4992_c0_g1~~TRINITY_DN4992_c0_g1_i1.p1  ORF type:complete len:187 (+),score=33.02 TRINITY_DN4992_c0_g1_i1:309-869(+)
MRRKKKENNQRNWKRSKNTDRYKEKLFVSHASKICTPEPENSDETKKSYGIESKSRSTPYPKKSVESKVEQMDPSPSPLNSTEDLSDNDILTFSTPPKPKKRNRKPKDRLDVVRILCLSSDTPDSSYDSSTPSSIYSSSAKSSSSIYSTPSSTTTTSSPSSAFSTSTSFSTPSPLAFPPLPPRTLR